MTKQCIAKAVMFVSILAASLLGAGSAFAQNRTISGTVVDTSGEPVIGAAVTVVGNSRIGAATDLNGAFSLSVPAGREHRLQAADLRHRQPERLQHRP